MNLFKYKTEREDQSPGRFTVDRSLFFLILLGIIIFSSGIMIWKYWKLTFQSIDVGFPGISFHTTGSQGKKPILIDYKNSTPEIRERTKTWYDKYYTSLHDLIGGPCEPFYLRVIHEDGGFISGGGGILERRALGEDTTIHVNGPLTEAKNFENVLSHELSHAFWAGVWPNTDGINASPAFIEEGIAQFLSQISMTREVREGNLDFQYQPGYLPAAITSYDSYAIQDKGATGGAIFWGDSTDFDTMQAAVLWDFMEESSPGFLKRFQEKICHLPTSPVNYPGGKKVIRVSLQTIEQLIKDSFGSAKIENKNILRWLHDQPVSNTHLIEGTFLRLQFRNKPRVIEEMPEGTSINPEQILITEVTRKNSSLGGEESVNFSPSVDAQIIDWRGNIIKPEITDIDGGIGINMDSLKLAEGSYKIIATDKEKLISGRTFFLVVNNNSDSLHYEKNIYGIFIEDDNVVPLGDVLSNAGNVKIRNGYFHFTIPSEKQELTIKMGDSTRSIFISKQSPSQLMLFQKK